MDMFAQTSASSESESDAEADSEAEAASEKKESADAEILLGQTEAQAGADVEAQTEIIGMITGLIKKATMMLLDPLADAVKEFIVDTTTPFTTGVLDNIENFGTQGRKQGHETFEQVSDHTKRTYHGGVGLPKRLVTGWYDGISGALSPITSKVTSGVSSAANSVKSTAKSAANSVVKDAKGVGNAAVNAVSWAGNKVTSGIRKGMAGVGNVVSGVAGGIGDVAKGVGGAVTRGVGRLFGMGDGRSPVNKGVHGGSGHGMSGHGAHGVHGGHGAGSHLSAGKGSLPVHHKNQGESTHMSLSYGGGRSPGDPEPLEKYG